MQLPLELEKFLPAETDVLFYEEHGYYVTGKVLPDGVIDTAIRGAERYWAGERDWKLPISNGFSDWKPGDGDGMRNSEFTALQNREIRALIEYPIIGAIAARLTRSPIIRLWDDQLLWKPPSTGPSGPVVGWHTDRAYWMTCTSEAMLTAWIPLQDIPEEMGPIMYVDGSHKWPDPEVMRTFNSQDLEAMEQRFLGDEKRSLKRAMALEKGQMAFHHNRTLHGSDVNRSDRPRKSVALHMQDGSNRYQTYLNEAGVPWHLINDDLARKQANGNPDYTDPAVFPVLWSDDGER